MGTCYSHLSPDERIRIERLHCEQGLIGRDLPPRARIDRTWDNGTECICLMVCVPVYRGVVDRVIGRKLTM